MEELRKITIIEKEVTTIKEISTPEKLSGIYYQITCYAKEAGNERNCRSESFIFSDKKEATSMYHNFKARAAKLNSQYPNIRCGVSSSVYKDNELDIALSFDWFSNYLYTEEK